MIDIVWMPCQKNSVNYLRASRQRVGGESECEFTVVYPMERSSMHCDSTRDAYGATFMFQEGVLRCLIVAFQLGPHFCRQRHCLTLRHITHSFISVSFNSHIPLFHYWYNIMLSLQGSPPPHNICQLILFLSCLSPFYYPSSPLHHGYNNKYKVLVKQKNYFLKF